VVVPIDDPLLRKELRTVLDGQLKSNRLQWQMQSDGSYVHSTAVESCQQNLIDLAEKGRLQRRPRRRGYAHLAVRRSETN
jgi:polyphosphate kinase